ncbi:hypothetical protein [Burkholderia pseudomallei]|uniref:hypothetical protein n=1 Tax=Burkholderia pseudomallei TaxID=28450 RepID=UPI000B01CB9B|nr:hypothetical protein [Burkholderia pseudomallei]MDS1023127.1 hypothetical protein [Burkholderia pseudomallei]MDV2081948.1 hypothetical protein [Burkholderia pseudomallei]MDV2172026.1 hypothetical protein [Burkholderia pseudomallei]MDV2213152.1 hypothetical protein [Burkholderia pseudomallei]
MREHRERARPQTRGAAKQPREQTQGGETNERQTIAERKTSPCTRVPENRALDVHSASCLSVN